MNLNEVQFCMQEIKKKIESLPSRDEMKLAIREGIDEALEDCDKRYATKATENIVYGLISTIIIAFIGLFIYLLQKHII